MSDRHDKHRLFPAIGDEGQEAIRRARVTLVGCGALGSNSAEMLVRAGIGTAPSAWIRIIDRDYVSLSNLQRQTLFDEEDARRARPKALAAAKHLEAIDSEVTIDPIVRDLTPSSAEKLLADSDVIVDATDNFPTRFLINDVAIASETPWIYGGVVASRGIASFILPGRSPCLRCLLEQVPAIGSVESCDTAGVITPLPAIVSGWQVAGALRWIVQKELEPGIFTFDPWHGTFARALRDAEPDPGCRSCGTKELPSLRESRERVVTLCGRNSVQISGELPVELDSAASRLRSIARIERSEQSLSVFVDEGILTLFA
ncbi:MAG: ThiF family adenylyltransferase, partial [Thermoanaerobaculia bacterium]|nr:ThiF family adenylyltransferase [Thermoanaerobaculia bacterium]